MKNIVKIAKSGFSFGLAPLILVLLGGGTILGLSTFGGGTGMESPFTVTSWVAMLGILTAFALLLGIAGVVFGFSLSLAKRIGGRMPDGALAVVMGTLFAVVFAASLIVLRDPLGRIACGFEHWTARAVCEVNAQINTQPGHTDAWRTIQMMLMFYASIVGLVIGGTVAETRGINIVTPAKAEAAPTHLNKRYRTRDEILAKVRAEEAAAAAEG
jgi:hypothetical protein